MNASIFSLLFTLDPMNHFAASFMTPELSCILDTTEICWGMVVIEEDSLWVDSLGVHFIGRLDYLPNENWGRTKAPEPPTIQTDKRPQVPSSNE